MQKIKKRYYLYFFILTGLFTFCLWNDNRTTFLHQTILIHKLNNLSSNIVEIGISPGSYEATGYTIQLSKADTLKLLGGFYRADSVPVGGHNSPVYECILNCKLKDCSNIQLLGSVHKNQEADLYISDTLWTKKNKGTYHRGMVYRARLPGLGRWIIEVDKRGLLSQ